MGMLREGYLKIETQEGHRTVSATSLHVLIGRLHARFNEIDDLAANWLPDVRDHPIFRNWNRLKADADYLAADGRCATAFSVAVLALEEVGKLIERRWSAMGIRPVIAGGQHRSKQVAAASAAMGAAYEDILRDRPDRDRISSSDWHGPIRDQLAESGGGYLSALSIYAAGYAWDHQKQQGFYEDPEKTLQRGVVSRHEISNADVNDVLILATVAVLSLLDKGALEFGAYLAPKIADRSVWEPALES
jgi:AbiV family abortive infection protein